jgi:hypothetical protein
LNERKGQNHPAALTCCGLIGLAAQKPATEMIDSSCRAAVEPTDFALGADLCYTFGQTKQ